MPGAFPVRREERRICRIRRGVSLGIPEVPAWKYVAAVKPDRVSKTFLRSRCRAYHDSRWAGVQGTLAVRVSVRLSLAGAAGCVVPWDARRKPPGRKRRIPQHGGGRTASAALA